MVKSVLNTLRHVSSQALRRLPLYSQRTLPTRDLYEGDCQQIECPSDDYPFGLRTVHFDAEGNCGLYGGCKGLRMVDEEGVLRGFARRVLR